MLDSSASRSKSLFIDFLSTAAEYRRKTYGRKQLIAKAVGIKANNSLKILDATAGFGQDAVTLAYLGCEVTMLERSPIIYALLEDAIKRAKSDADFAKLKLTLINCDAINHLKKLINIPDVIYLDPMYPSKTKSALNKINMRILRSIVGEDLDAAELLEISLRVASKRVVVKRPRLAPQISGPKPDIIYAGKSCRFDVYLNKKNV